MFTGIVIHAEEHDYHAVEVHEKKGSFDQSFIQNGNKLVVNL